jgi:WD40 repeat protein
MIYS